VPLWRARDGVPIRAWNNPRLPGLPHQTLLPLIATLAALMCGPLLYLLAHPRPALLAFLDGFVLVSIAGLVLLEVVPGAYGDGGAWSLGFLALGAIGPTLVEQGLERARREAHLATLALAVIGLVLHSLGDGAALAPVGDGSTHAGHGHAHEALAIAIVVHSVPVGLVVWWIMAPVFGRGLPTITLALMGSGTLVGYLFGLELNQVLGARAFAWFQALVAGSILHVVFGRPHLEEDSDHREPQPPFEGLGNLFALVALIGLARLDPHAATLQGIGATLVRIGMVAAPLLLVAYAGAGLVGALRAPAATSRWRRGLRVALVDAVDASAARLLAALLLLAALDLATAWGGAPRLTQWPALGAIPPWPGLVLVLLFGASLLRRGGRRWLSSVVGRPSAHSH
jgi:zinc transporter ZupT